MTTDHFIIKTGWLIDGTGNPFQRNRIIEVKNGVIQLISSADSPITDKIDVLDFSDCTIIPGLIDSHVHLFMSGSGDLEIRNHQLDAPFETAEAVIRRHIQAHLAHGVVAVRDGGDKHAHCLRYKSKYFNSNGAPFRLSVSGKAWHQRGRYGKLIGRPPTEGRKLHEALMEDTAPVDTVKIVNSGLNSLVVFGKETLPQFNLAELKAAIDVAHEKGLKTMIHANGKHPVQISVDSGCDSIEHGFFMGKDNLLRLAERQTTWIPTAVTMAAYARHLEGKRVDICRRNLDHQLEQIRQAGELGVPLALGTDSGSLGVHHGASLAWEMKLFMQAGLSIEEAVQCAASSAAGLSGCDYTGIVAKQHEATFVAVSCAPSELPDNLNRIAHLYIKGKPFTIPDENAER